MKDARKIVPALNSELRTDIVKAPETIKNATGINLYGKP